MLFPLAFPADPIQNPGKTGAAAPAQNKNPRTDELRIREQPWLKES